MVRNLVLSVILYGQVSTTLAKAKAALPILERLTHRAKVAGPTTKRYLMSRMFNNELLVRRLMKDIAPKYKKVSGGYLRVIKMRPRVGDNAAMARIEFV